MALPKDIKAARKHLKQIADAHPDDVKLKSLIEMMRHQLQLVAEHPTPYLRRAMEARTADLEAHMNAQGYGSPEAQK